MTFDFVVARAANHRNEHLRLYRRCWEANIYAKLIGSLEYGYELRLITFGLVKGRLERVMNTVWVPSTDDLSALDWNYTDGAAAD